MLEQQIRGDMIIPVVITVYQDKSFSFITKTPPAALLIKKACNIKSGSANSKKTKVATISKAKVQEIAELKMKDLNAASLEAAMSMIAGGTARSMGVTVKRNNLYILVGGSLPIRPQEVIFRMKKGKKYQDAVKAIYDRSASYDKADAIALVKKMATAKFDETVECHLRTGCRRTSRRPAGSWCCCITTRNR